MKYARLYSRDLNTTIANLAANPAILAGRFADVHFHLVITPTTDPATKWPISFERAIAEQLVPAASAAAAIGRTIAPGFRLMEARAIGDVKHTPISWDDPVQWADNTARLGALLAHVPTWSTIAFDAEDYAGAMPAPDPASMAAVLAPFIKRLIDHKIVPCFYPTELNGLNSSIAVGLILDAVGGCGELWTEQGYGLSDELRRGGSGEHIKLSMMTIEAQARRRWPAVHVRHGHQIRALRDWISDAKRAALEDVGMGWFDESTDRPDNPRIGTPAWLTGVSAHATNDSAHRWTAPKNLDAHVPGEGTAKLETVQIVPAPVDGRRDLTSDLGYLITDGRCLRGSLPGGVVLPKTGDFSVLIDLVIPAKQPDGPLFGASQLNSESWQVVLDEGGAYLELRVGAGPMALAILTMKTGVVSRFAISRWGAKWFANGEELPTPSNAVATQAGNFWIGAGVVMGGTKIQTYSDGLVLVRCEVWHRHVPGLATLPPFPRFM